MRRLAKQQGCTIVLVTHDNRILDIADRIISLEDGQLSESKGELLLSLSNLMSSILEMDIKEVTALMEPLSNAQFANFLTKLNAEFEQLLSTVNLLSNRSLNNKLELVIQTISLKVAQILKAEQVTFFIVDRERERLWSKNARGKGGELISIEIPLESGIAGYVARTGKSINIPDPYSDPRFNPQVDRDTGFTTRHILCLPMFDLAGQVFAVVQALNKITEQPFDPEDEAKFYELTQFLGTVLNSSITYAQKSYTLTSQTLDGNISDLKVQIESFSTEQFVNFLSRFNQEFENILATKITLEDPVLRRKLKRLIQVISWKTIQMLQVEQVTLFIVNQEKQMLRTTNAVGGNKELFTLEFPITKGISGYAARTGECVIVPDPYSDSRFNPQGDRNTGFVTRNILSLPIFAKYQDQDQDQDQTQQEIQHQIDTPSDQVIAVIQALNKLGDLEFNPADQEKLERFVDVLGPVLQTSIQCMQKSYEYGHGSGN
jgi:GAF domain-containing protein